ncbi:MAG: polyprenyl synthetase family protein [Jiangellaceae bacterium]
MHVLLSTRTTPTSVAARPVEAFLAEFLEGEAHRWADVPHATSLVADLRHAVLGGGKRLRPTFCHWGHVGATGTDAGETGVRLGAALELVHTFALVHDDVMDGSPTRRGAPSAHARLAARHAHNGWRGERRRFAEGMAVLVGDLAFALAQRLVSELPVQVRRSWHAMCSELVLGQYLDLQGAADGDRDAGYAAMVSTLKSGRYTVVRPLQLGAALAGELDRLEPVYAAYGEPLGEAFQLRDDLLGVFGDPAVTGKPAGDDLREGKPTLLLSLTTERAPDSARPVIERIGRPDLTDADIATIAELAWSTGAVDEVDLRIEAAVERSRAALDHPELDAAAAPALYALTEAAAWRDR